MGLLDQVIGSVLGGSRQEADPQSGAAGMSPLVKALLLALAAKAAQSYLHSAAPARRLPAAPLLAADWVIFSAASWVAAAAAVVLGAALAPS